MTQETPTPGSSAYLLNRIIIVVSFIGIFIAGTLSYSHLVGSTPPCGPGGGGCADVLTSPYAYLFGVPVAFIGLGAYLAMAGLSLLRSTKAGSDWTFLLKLTFAFAAIGVLASFGFTFLSLVFLNHMCIWCISSALTMIVLFFLHASLWSKSAPEPAGSLDVVAGAAGLILAFALMVPAVMNFEKGNSSMMKTVKVDKVTRDGLIPTDPQKVWGDPKAKVVLIEFADANCPTCRMAYGEVKKILDSRPTLAYAFRNFPLYTLPGHETSLQVAAAMEFAAESSKYREFFDKVFEEGNTNRIKEISGIVSLARETGLDSKALSQMLNGKGDGEKAMDKLVEKVSDDFNLAQSYNITGTPTFILYADGVGAKALSLKDVAPTLGQEPYASLLKQP